MQILATATYPPNHDLLAFQNWLNNTVKYAWSQDESVKVRTYIKDTTELYAQQLWGKRPDENNKSPNDCREMQASAK